MINWLTPCAWTDDAGALHIDVPRMLDELGVPDTPETRKVMTAMASDILCEMLKNRAAVIKVTE